MSQIAPCNEQDASVGYPTPSATLTGQVAHKRSLLPPIERIPTEILDTIFKIVHESSEYSLTVYLNSCSLSLPLSHVCSRWRRTAHSRPSLWASIFIDRDRVRGEIRHIVKVHLENAGSHPLRIGLVARYCDTGSTPFRDDVLRMIVPELQRCEELLFHGEWSELARVAPLQLSVTFPHLRSLNVNYSFSAPVPASVRHLFHALKIAPKLETVDITSTISPEDLPCHQLTTVRGSDLEVAQVAHILRSCPNLKNLELDLLLIGPGSPSNVVVHSSLREFRIRANPDWLIDIVNSLARFSFPALQTFTLNMKTSGMILIDPTSGVIEVIRRFSASLRKVVLITGSQSLHRTLCRDILQICPNLHSFAIEVYAYSEDDRDSEYILHLIQSLTIMDVSQAFLAPKLTELCLLEHDSRMSAEYATAFLDMVESRSAGIGVSRLTDAELKSTSAWVAQLSSDASIVERIKQLSRKGIRCALGAI